MGFEVRVLTAERFGDLERLFGPEGADGGCWCMFLRLTSREFNANGSEGNRRALRAVVEEGRTPGLLAYDEAGEPVGWVSVAPREEYPRVLRSPITKPVDEEPAWAVVCFFVAREARGSGVATALLEAAMEYAGGQGAQLLEAYPVDAEGRIPAASGWHGTASMFRAAGFEEVVRRGERRPVMRVRVGGGR